MDNKLWQKWVFYSAILLSGCSAFDLESKFQKALRPAIDSSALTNVTFGNAAVTRNLSDYVAGGTPPYAIQAVVSGNLPAYLNLSVNSGIVTVARNSSVAPPATLAAASALPLLRITITDSSGNVSSGDLTLSLTYKRVFVASDYISSDKATWSSNATYNYADCQGTNAVEIANCRCRAAATGAKLSNAQKFRVWLSTSTVDARCNLIGSTSTGCSVSQLSMGPWYNMAGQLIAYDAGTTALQGLYNTTGIISAIQYNEKATAATTTVWSGTNNDGTYQTGFTCADWTSTGGGNTYSHGSSNLTAGTAGLAPYWHGTSNAGCDGTARGLYCFEGE